jgi:hypothetical protein
MEQLARQLLHVQLAQPAQRIIVNTSSRWCTLSFTRKQGVTCSVTPMVPARVHIPLVLHSSQRVCSDENKSPVVCPVQDILQL